MDLLAHQSVMKTPRGADSKSAALRLVSASGRTSTRVSMLHRRVRAPQDVFNEALPRTLSPDKSYAPLKTHVQIIDSTRPGVPRSPLADARGYSSASSSPLVGQQAHGHSLAVAAR
jgi:hypothetical protein